MKKKYLPIGTVVMLKEATKKIMIIGFKCHVKDDISKEYDYAGVIYPEGLIDSSQNLVFNHEQIDKIYYVGYMDKDENEFKEKLNKL